MVKAWRSEQRLLLCNDFEEALLLHIMSFWAEIFQRCAFRCLVHAGKTVFSFHFPSYRYYVPSDRGQKQGTAESAEQFSEFRGQPILTQRSFVSENLTQCNYVSLLFPPVALTHFSPLELQILHFWWLRVSSKLHDKPATLTGFSFYLVGR